MRIEALVFAAAFAPALPVVAEAQHSHGGSGRTPKEIRADVGETVTLQVRRSGPVCLSGLTIPKRKLNLDLPLDETVPVTLELKQAELIELQCTNEDAAAVIIVGSP